MHHRPARAVIYVRYSSDLQNPNSVRDQIANCRELARRKGWQVVAEYADEAMSATRSDRPGFVRLSNDLAGGGFDLVLAESLDRISRSMKDTAEFYDVARFHGIGIHTVDAGEIALNRSSRVSVRRSAPAPPTPRSSNGSPGPRSSRPRCGPRPSATRATPL